MAFSNNEEFGINGVSQNTLVEYLIHLQGVVDGLAAMVDTVTTKLNADAGVTDADYATDHQASVQALLPATAGPVGGSTSVATVSTAVVDYTA